jgi:cysteine desulfurase
MKSIAISLGSACNSSEIVPSHVLLAMGFSPEMADATIRVSIGRLTTLAEIDQMIDILSDEINQMKR